MRNLTSNQISGIVWTNKALTAVGYISYPLLLALLCMFEPVLLPQEIVVPAAGFIAVTIVRHLVNAPRPYENGGAPALIDKSTKGHSFPSRHTFCMFMIAYAWLAWQPIVGIILLACAITLATCRVLLRVHFPRDVIAAAILATLFAIIGFWIL